MADTDVRLSVDLDVRDAEKTAKELQQEIKDVFESTKDSELSASMTNLEIQMKKSYDTAEMLRQKLEEAGKTVPTKEYEEVTQRIQELNQAYNEVDAKLLSNTKSENENVKAAREKLHYVNQYIKTLTAGTETEAERAQALQKTILDAGNIGEKGQLWSGEELVAYKAELDKIVSTNEELIAQRNALSAELGELYEREDELIANHMDVVVGTETEEYKKLELQLDAVNDKLKQQLIRYNEIQQAQAQTEERVAKQEERDQIKDVNQEFRNANQSITALNSSIRGIGRLIPGVSTKAVMSISMITRGVTRLTRLTSKDLVTALNYVRVAFDKLLLAILKNPILLVIAAIIAALVLLVKKIKKVYDETKEQVDAIVDIVKKGAAKALKFAGKSIATMTKGFFKLGTGIVKGFTTVITTIIDKLKSLKSTITEGLKAMAKWNDGVNGVNTAMSNLTSSFEYLKSALTTAFVPILIAIEPLLTSLTDRLAEITTMVGMFIAKLTGATSFQKAVRVQNDYAKSLDKTAKAAKDAEAGLAGFDKLNVLNTDKTKKAEEALSIDFEEVDLQQTPFPDWLGDLEKLGRKVGVVVSNFLGKIPWNDVIKKAQAAGKGVADFVNGLISVEGIGDSIGRAFGKAINTVTGFVNNFLGNLKGEQLGKTIGDALILAIRSIDFGEIGRIFSNSLNTLADIVAGITDKFDGKELGKKFTDFLQNALGKINWTKIRKAVLGVSRNLTGFINTAFTSKNLTTVASTISNAFNTISMAIRNFVYGVQWGDFGTGIGDAINTFFTDMDWQMAASGINGLAKGLLKGIKAAVETINWDEISDSIITFISNIDWAGIAKNAVEISTKLRDALNDIWYYLKESDAFDQILDLIVDFLSEKSNWEEAFKQIKKDFVWKLIWAKLGHGFEEIKENLQLLGTDFKEFFSEGFKAIGELVSMGFQSVKQFFSDGFKAIGELCKIAFSALKQKVIATTQGIKDTFTNLKVAIQAVWGKITEKIINAWENIKEGVKKPINGFLSLIETMINKVISGFNWMIDKLNALSFDVPDWVPGIGGDTFGFNIKHLGEVEIPKLAQGTVIPPNMSNFLAMLGDNNKETEVVSPLSTIEQALRNVMAEQNINVTFKVEGDPNRIFKVVQEQAKIVGNRTGNYAWGGT